MNSIFTLERVTQPDIEPVTLAEMKRHLRAFDSVTAEDEDMQGLVTAAREWVEDYTGRALVDQTWRLTIEQGGVTGDLVAGFSGASNYGYYRGQFEWTRLGGIALRKSPILGALTKFVSVAADGTETDVLAGTYEVREPNSKWPRVAPLSGAAWAAGSLRIEFRAGFVDRLGSPQQGPELVPVRFKQAMKLWAEANYDRDEKMMSLLLKAAHDLIHPERAELNVV